MEDKLTALKTAIAATFSAVGVFLGWQGVLAVLWVAAMATDYISGTIAAIRLGEWTSRAARDGALHKVGMLFVVIVAGLADITLSVACENLPVPWEWPILILPLVFAWHILTELGSILENAVKMGAPIPEWLMAILSAGLKIISAQAPELPNASAEEDGISADDLNADQLRAVMEQLGLSRTYTEGLTREQLLAELDKMADSDN